MLLAAGKSTRMGMPKQEIPLLGVPALIYTLRAFEQAESVGRTVLVCPAAVRSGRSSIGGELSPFGSS